MQLEQLASMLIKKNLDLLPWMKGVEIAEKLREMNVSPQEMLQYIEAAHELSDPEFRRLVYADYEVMKRVGKTPREMEDYNNELYSQTEAKEKRDRELNSQLEDKREQSLEWDERIKGKKAESHNWEQKLKDGEAALGKCRREFEDELRHQNVVRENVEEALDHAAQLQSMGLDLPTFDSILREMVQEKGISPDIGKKVKEKIKQVGSLDKAIAEMKKNKESKKREISKLSREELEKNKSLERLDDEIERQKQVIKDQEEVIGRNRDQFELFEAFICMLLTSPSAQDPLSSLGKALQGIGRQGWMPSTRTTPERQRAMFVFLVMGAYLHSIHCYKCGASFLVNRSMSSSRSSYYCPVCGPDGGTRADDSFLRRMTSSNLSNLIRKIRSILRAEEQNASD